MKCENFINDTLSAKQTLIESTYTIMGEPIFASDVTIVLNYTVLFASVVHTCVYLILFTF